MPDRRHDQLVHCYSLNGHIVHPSVGSWIITKPSASHTLTRSSRGCSRFLTGGSPSVGDTQSVYLTLGRTNRIPMQAPMSCACEGLPTFEADSAPQKSYFEILAASSSGAKPKEKQHEIAGISALRLYTWCSCSNGSCTSPGACDLPKTYSVKSQASIRGRESSPCRPPG